MPDEQQNSSKPDKKLSRGGLHDLVKAESMLQLALAVPAGCLIGWVVGAWLDKHFHQSWIAVAGILFGAVAGFIQIFTVAARYMKNGR